MCQWLTEMIAEYPSEAAAREALPGIRGQDWCLGARVLQPKREMRGWCVQAFFPDIAPAPLPLGCHRRWVPESLLESMR